VVNGEKIGASAYLLDPGRAWIVIDGDVMDSNRTDEDIYAVGTGAGHELLPVVGTRADEQTGAVSPDGKWIALRLG